MMSEPMRVTPVHLVLVLMASLTLVTPVRAQRPSAPAPDPIDRVRAELREGRLDAALAMLCEAVAAQPKDARLVYLRAGVCAAVAEACPRLADADRAEATKLAPDAARMERYAEGLALLALNAVFDAQRALSQAAGEKPQDLETIVRWARARRSLGYWGSPLSEVHELAGGLEPRTRAERWYRLEADLLRDAHEAALSAAAALLKEEPDAATAFVARGVALQALDRHAEAVQSFARALELSQVSPFTLDRLALSRARLGDGPGAERALDLALKLDPHCGYALWHRATLHALRADWAAALRDAERLVEERAGTGSQHYAALREQLSRARDGREPPTEEEFPWDAGMMGDEEPAPGEEPKPRTFFPMALVPPTEQPVPRARPEFYFHVPAPEVEQAFDALAALLKRASDAAEATEVTDAPREQALAALRAGNAPLALFQLDRAIAADPKDARAWAWRAAARGVFRGALEWTARVDHRAGARLEPRLAHYESLGSALVKQFVLREPATAVGPFQTWLAVEAWDMEAIVCAARQLAASSDHEDQQRAAMLYDTLLGLEPTNAVETACFRDATLRRLLLRRESGATKPYARGEELLASFSRDLEQDPKDAAACVARGALQLELGRGELALQDLARALELDPKSVDAHVWTGNARLARGETDAALAALRARWSRPEARRSAAPARAHPARRGASRRCDRGLRRAARARAGRSPRARSARQTCAFKADIEEALAEYGRALEAAPDAATYVKRGRVYLRVKEWTRARADFESALALGCSVQAEAGLDECFAAERGVPLERARGDRILAKTPLTGADHARRGEVYEARGEYDLAAAEYEEAIEPGNPDPYPWYLRGRLRAKLGRDDDAFQDLKLCLERDPGFDEARIALLPLLERYGHHQAVLEEATTVLGRQRGNLYVRERRGYAAYALRDFDRAIEDFGMITRADASNVGAQVALGRAYFDRGSVFYSAQSYRSALADYTRSIACTPRPSAAHFNCALCWVQLGDEAKAKAEEQKARELDASLPPVRYASGAAAERAPDRASETCAFCGGAGSVREPDHTVYGSYSSTLTTVDRWGSTTTRILSSGGGMETIKGDWVKCSWCGGSGLIWM